MMYLMISFTVDFIVYVFNLRTASPVRLCALYENDVKENGFNSLTRDPLKRRDFYLCDSVTQNHLLEMKYSP